MHMLTQILFTTSKEKILRRKKKKIKVIGYVYNRTIEIKPTVENEIRSLPLWEYVWQE